MGKLQSIFQGTLRRRDPAVPWNDIAGMRDFVVHNYFNVDVEAVYKTVIVDIPLLQGWIEAILRDFKDP